MKPCDCGCIEVGERDNHPPAYVCRCSICSGHTTGWVHQECAEKHKDTALEEHSSFVPIQDDGLFQEARALLKRQVTPCACKDCKNIRTFIERTED